ncbi:MAG: hypothetical protein COC01_07915 [Bacteroidetes bacterium]|nr:MAG: hypothetical protein COC01_07915 [Bacteroidota bacterium]
MTSNVETPWLKIIGWAVLIHVILIALSILEVAVYAMLIDPGHEESFYQAHAEISAPYISIFFGIPLFNFVARLLAKNKPGKELIIGLGLPNAYIVMDIIMLIFAEVNWAENYVVLGVSFTSKILASYVGARTVNRKQQKLINS